jgi:hypothetical protein
VHDKTISDSGFTVTTNFDRVILKYKGIEAVMPYAAAFKIAQGIRIAAKQSSRLSGEAVRDWRTKSHVDNPTLVVPTSDLIRTTKLPMKFRWRVGFESEEVLLQLSDQVIRMHFMVAYKLQTVLRHEGKNAKAWAGDTNRHKNASGYLHDASRPHVPVHL